MIIYYIRGWEIPAMEEEKIVLDSRSFEALAVESRVRILKSLRERRKTLSELAEGMKMSVSGTKEHLQVLEEAGLVRKMDDGHKWKYYELTKKGSEIVAPKELRVWILLSISTIALVMSVMAIFYAMPAAYLSDNSAAPSVAAAPQAAPPMLGTEAKGMNATAGAVVPRALQNAPVNASGPDWVPAAVAAISALTLAGCITVLWRNRSRARA
jgi:DNA-binding transcriptional ArsR family regulator